MSLLSRFLILLFFSLSINSASFADTYDMYRTDYAKGAFCSAVAGACASDIDPENSYFQNPASLEAGELGLNFDGDFNPSDNIEPGMKTSDQISETTFMGGLGNAGKRFGWAFSFSGRSSKVKADASFLNDQDQLKTLSTEDTNLTLIVNVPVAYKLTNQLTAGISLVGMYYTENIDVVGSKVSTTVPVRKFPSLAMGLGGIYKVNKNLRFGAWMRTPISFQVDQNLNYQNSTFSAVSSERVELHYPFMSAIGTSIMPFGDERTILFDLEFVGTTLYGYERTLDTFDSASNTTVKLGKGRRMVVQPHLAWRSPWYQKSKGTYYLGGHYEASRWTGLSSRLHGVVGASYKVDFIGMEVLVGADIAKDFFGLQISFR